MVQVQLLRGVTRVPKKSHVRCSTNATGNDKKSQDTILHEFKRKFSNAFSVNANHDTHVENVEQIIQVNLL